MTTATPRVGDAITVSGRVRSVTALVPDGHVRITVDVDLGAPLDQEGSAADPKDPGLRTAADVAADPRRLGWLFDEAGSRWSSG